MPGPGPRDSCSPAPLRPLLLLLCALAPGAPGFAPGGWPPRSLASARPLSLRTPCPPLPGCKDRSGVWDPPEPRSAIGSACGREEVPLLFELQCPHLGRSSARPSRGLSSERRDGARSICKRVGSHPPPCAWSGKLAAGRCRRGPGSQFRSTPQPRRQPPAHRLGTAGGPWARGPVSRGPALPASPSPECEGAGAEREAGVSSPPRPAGLRRASGGGAPGSSRAAGMGI